MKYFIIRYVENGCYIQNISLRENEPVTVLSTHTSKDARIFTENQADSIHFFIDDLNIELIEVTDSVKIKLSL